MTTPTAHQVAKASAEVSPPVGLVTWNYLAEQPIDKWLTALAIVYTLLQIVVLVRKEFIKRRRKA